MSMTSLPDDTKPRSPFKEPPQIPATPQPLSQQPPPPGFIDPEGDTAAGPGCWIFGLVGAFALLLALIIVGLAGFAGWTSGVRIAQSNATATVEAGIDLQVQAISTNIAEGNVSLLNIRLNFLAEQTPAISQLPQLQQTGTALYLTMQPTQTPTPTATLTPEASVSTATPTPTATATIVLTGSDLNLPQLLNEAKAAVNEGRYDEAIEQLDVVIASDPLFEKSTVTSLMSSALNKQALRLLRSGDVSMLAEGIYLADRAEQFGPLEDGVNFERDVATLYLSARATINTSDFANSISLLNDVLAFAPNYLDTRDLLAKQYVAYGDALLVSQPCDAVTQYVNAVSINGTSAEKRATAQDWCDNGTPTPEGFVPTLAAP